MKLKPLLYTSLLLMTALAVQASPVLILGTPGDDLLATPTGPSPNLGGLLFTFSSLTPFSTFNPTTYASASQGVTISSPDGLLVLPFSTQSNPNYLFDNSTEGTADITISAAGGAGAIGVGIADSDDPINVVLEALGAGNSDLGTFNVTTDVVNAESEGPNPGNTYFVVKDTTPDIYGLVITQTDASELNSGLAIADVQVTPEPSSLAFMVAGILAIVGCSRLRKRA